MERRPPTGIFLRDVLLLLVLAALIWIPRPLAGGLDLLQAESLREAGEGAGVLASLYASAGRRIPWRPDLFEQAGDAFTRAGLYDQAEAMYRLAGERQALSPAGWLAWGRARHSLGDGPGAGEVWELGLSQPGASPYLHFYLASLQEELGQPQAAIAHWRAFLAENPEHGWAHYRLGLLEAAQDPAAALPELMQAARLSPELDETVQGLRTSLNLALLADRPSDQRRIAGQALAALGEWNLALLAFQNAALADPRDGLALAWAGEAKQQIGQDGTTEIERAVAIAPDSAVVLGFYGRFLQRTGRTAEAVTAYQQALRLAPGDAVWELALANAYEQEGDLVSAYGLYLAAAEASPAQPSTWRALGEFCLRNGVHLETSGRRAAEQLLELDGDNWHSQDLAGQILLANGETLQAEELLQKALAEDPTRAAPALHLGILYLQTGRVELAYSYLVQAQAFDPEGSSGWQAGRLLEAYFP